MKRVPLTLLLVLGCSVCVLNWLLTMTELHGLLRNHMPELSKRSVDDVTNRFYIHPKTSFYTQVPNERVYMYSAFALPVNEARLPLLRKPSNTVVPNACEHTEFIQGHEIYVNIWRVVTENMTDNFTCCVYKSDRSIVGFSSTQIMYFYHRVALGRLQQGNFICYTELPFNTIQGVTINTTGSNCSEDTTVYLPVELIEYNKVDRIAVLLKLKVLPLDTSRLIEWIEAIRYLSDDLATIFIFTNNLDNITVAVLNHYQNKGVVKVMEIDYPERISGPNQRKFMTEDNQKWNDMQVQLTYFQAKASAYKYATVLDNDEFLVPNVPQLKGSWMPSFDEEFRKDRASAGIRFKTVIHVNTWTLTHPNASRWIGSNINGSHPVVDAPRYVLIPRRAKHGTSEDHAFDTLPGFKGPEVIIGPGVNNRPQTYVLRGDYSLFGPIITSGPQATSLRLLTDDAILVHHYRACKNHWTQLTKLVKNWDDKLYSGKNKIICEDFRRYEYPIMARLAQEIDGNVEKVRKLFGVRLF